MRDLRRAARHNAVFLVLICLSVPVTVVAGWVTWSVSSRLFTDEVITRSQALLAVQAATLERQLDKFRLLPPLLAQRPDVRDLVLTRDRSAGERVAAIAAGMAGAQEVAFYDPAGHLIASSHMLPRGAGLMPARDTTALPLEEALQGRLGRAYRPGNRSLPGSYVFASATRGAQGSSGAVVVWVSLGEVEQAWALSKAPLVAVDGEGQVVASNRPAWRGQRLSDQVEPLGAVTVTLAETDSEAETAPAALPQALDLVRLPDEGPDRSFLRMTRRLPLLGWQVIAFADTTAARSQAFKATAIAVLACLLFSGIGWVALERRQAGLRRMREDRLSALRLERRVRQRTRDLSEANTRLASEVREREAAEEELRRMQADLVQAAKMATLGQMSAALSHEFNQPLAAIRSNADNAKQFLGLGRLDKAGTGLDKIIVMVERMAEISRILKGFSRRAGTRLGPIAVKPVIDEALMLLSPRLKQTGARLEVRHLDGPIQVIGGHVRLEQVVLNLAANALDAVEGEADGAVVLSTYLDGDFGVIEVADNGPGVAEELLSQVFDPFFTTKDVGKGLGLGLSIAYKIVHDFSGTLAIGKGKTGGAVFTVRLPRADRASEAAA